MSERLGARSAGMLGALALAGCAAAPGLRFGGPLRQGLGALDSAPPGQVRSRPLDPLAGVDLRPFDDEEAWRPRGTLLLGERTLQRSFGLGRGDQAVIGVELAGGPPDSWLEMELGLWGSARGRNLGQWLDRVLGEPRFEDLVDDDAGIGSSTMEFSIGVQKRLLLFGGQLRPFVGAGAAAIRRRSFRIEPGGVDDDSDGDLGWYAHGGVHILWGNGVGIGIDFRRLGGTDLTLDGIDTSGDYDQWSLSFGFGV